MSRPIVYISGPITLGDREHNLRQAQKAHLRLMAAGFAVINPILTMTIPGCWDVPHDDWIAADLPLIEKADALLRLSGESKGADEEVDHAYKCEIPVFENIDHLIGFFFPLSPLLHENAALRDQEADLIKYAEELIEPITPGSLRSTKELSAWNDKEYDLINHPPHYTHGGIEAIDVIEAWELGYDLGNALKYIARHAYKGKPLEDMRKCRWYLNRYIGVLEEADQKSCKSK